MQVRVIGHFGGLASSNYPVWHGSHTLWKIAQKIMFSFKISGGPWCLAGAGPPRPPLGYGPAVYARSLRPIALQLFCAPCSSAASQRVFSQAGLIMRPHGSRLSKSMLAQLVFLKCNNNLLWNASQLTKVHFNQTVDSDCWKFKTCVYISD